MWGWWVLGCAAPAPFALEATCTVHETTLRCTATTNMAVSLRLSATGAGDEPIGPGVVGAPGTSHELTLWGLIAGEAHAWTVEAEGGGETAVRGTVEAGWPEVLGAFSVVRTVGGSAPFGFVAMNVGCDDRQALVVLDGLGRLRWSHDLSDHGVMVTALERDPDGTLITIVEDRRVMSVAPDGTERVWFDLDQDVRPHHHLARWGDDVVMLFATPWVDPVDGRPYMVDGIGAWGEDGAVRWSWTLDAYLAPGEEGWSDEQGYWFRDFDGLYDAFHTNSFAVDEGGVILSFHARDQVVRLEGPLDAPTGVAWVAIGGDLRPDDGVVLDGARFSGQHHVGPDGDAILVFDNASGPTSRGVRLAVDVASRRVSEVGSYPFPVMCRVGGSVWPTADGGVFAMCGEGPILRAFDDASRVNWEVIGACDGVGGATYRAVPFDTLWP